MGMGATILTIPVAGTKLRLEGWGWAEVDYIAGEGGEIVVRISSAHYGTTIVVRMSIFEWYRLKELADFNKET